MQIDIVNNSSSPAAGPGASTVAAGSARSYTGRTVDELLHFQDLHGSTDLVQVSGTLEDADQPPLVVDVKAPADPAGGTYVLAAEGFDVEDLAGSAVSYNEQFYFGVFDDATYTTPSADGTLDTAATGTIDAGAGTNLLLVTPSGGVLSVTLTATGAGEFWLKAWPAGAGRVIDSSDFHKTTFTAP